MTDSDKLLTEWGVRVSADAGMPEDHEVLGRARNGKCAFRGCWILDHILEKR